MPVTLRDIAKHLGISHATVSFVLNNRMDMGITEATRQRVLTAAEELGYRPNRAARALTTGRTDMLAVCLPSTSDGYYSTLLQGVQEAVTGSEFEIVVWQSQTDGALRKRPVDLNVDGYLAFDLDSPDSEFVNGSGSMKPGVNVGMVRREGWDNVLVDVSAAAIEAFQHLINIGCRRIAYLRPATQGQPKDSLYRTFRSLKSTPGITTDEIQTHGLDRKKAMEAVKDYTQKWGAPEGIVCFNDGLAIAAKRALSELGIRTPNDVAIVGSGGIEEAEYAWPPISTIEHPIKDICRTSWEFLEHRVEWPTDEPQEMVFQAKFVARESSTGFRRKR
ncbi:MAG TPA: LacI family DNA-binding transcriptional regulator [Fimbriimonadaceae bacterium]|nr:LacI family DNA-binding transcriptional regulator [Fimbriimonadaceae bacterium]